MNFIKFDIDSTIQRITKLIMSKNEFLLKFENTKNEKLRIHLKRIQYY